MKRDRLRYFDLGTIVGSIVGSVTISVAFGGISGWRLLVAIAAYVVVGIAFACLRQSAATDDAEGK